MRATTGLVCALACLAPWSVEACTVDEDCSLNGVCIGGTPNGPACKCDVPWTGPACAQLVFKPAPVVGAYGYAPNVSSTWGGNPVQDANGLWHLYVAEMVDGCGLAYWLTNSQIVHATSETVEGPYTKKNVALGVWAHSPRMLKVTEADGSDAYLLFHVGTGTDANTSKHCPPNPPDATPPAAALRPDAAATSRLHRSSSPDGPFEPVAGYPGCSDPAPFQHPNGTIFVACTPTPQIQLLRADDYRGPWSKAGVLNPDGRFPAGTGTWEDVHLYMDGRHHWHLLAHTYIVPDFRDPVSGQAFSRDGVRWTFSAEQPYGANVTQADGSVLELGSRERPWLLFNRSTGAPSHLINGVNSKCAGHDKR
jgi:hypothetical protein